MFVGSDLMSVDVPPHDCQTDSYDLPEVVSACDTMMDGLTGTDLNLYPSSNVGLGYNLVIAGR